MAASEKFLAQLLREMAFNKHAASIIKIEALPEGTARAITTWVNDNNIPTSSDTESAIYILKLPNTGFSDICIADFAGDDAETFRATGVFYDDKLLVQSMDVSD